MSKTQEFLVGRTIVKVENPPRKIILTLDNGNKLEIVAWECGDWDPDPCLDFRFIEKEK